jgi:hypothetical protein
MRIVRFRQHRDEPARWGWVRDDRVGPLDGSPFGLFSARRRAWRSTG